MGVRGRGEGRGRAGGRGGGGEKMREKNNIHKWHITYYIVVMLQNLSDCHYVMLN